MPAVAAKRITEYVRDLAGDELRTVVTISDDGYEIHYLSDRLQREYTRDVFEEVVAKFRLREPFLSSEFGNEPIGERRALIDYHENACIIRVPYSDTETIVISISREAGRNMVEFIEECRKIVHGNS